MQIDASNVQVKTEESSFTPALNIMVGINYFDEQAPILINGYLRDSEYKILSAINPIVKREEIFEMKIEGYLDAIQRTKYVQKEFTSLLDRNVLGRIENMRMKNPQHDVHLIITLNSIAYQLNRTNRQMQIVNTCLDHPIRIPQSDWLKGYASKFEMGDFILLEFQLPKTLPVDSNANQKIVKALSIIEKQKERINQGQWTESLRESRNFFELFKGDKKDKETQIFELNSFAKSLISQFNLSESDVQPLYNSVSHVYQFLNKFSHVLDKKDESKYIDPIVHKEDAIFFYNWSICFLNLLSEKIRRSGK